VEWASVCIDVAPSSVAMGSVSADIVVGAVLASAGIVVEMVCEALCVSEMTCPGANIGDGTSWRGRVQVGAEVHRMDHW
jgi:hypothetical protein